jgi:proteasome lid subunit RPN8/RPN11
MIEHAQSALPNECCGLLGGVIEERVIRADSWHPLVNEAASPTAYLSEPKSLFRAIKAMRNAKQEIVAIYHSHPNSNPVPSKTDLERNYHGSEVVHLIIGLNGPAPLICGWRLTETDFSEAEWEEC